MLLLYQSGVKPSIMGRKAGGQLSANRNTSTILVKSVSCHMIALGRVVLRL
jgi:hypothetical protein